tara:strand:+ start:363 stop:725 length:363 start_codon:yes stop_codon:yes gene_type:complete
MSESTIPVELAPGEAFIRVKVDENGGTSFSCGVYPTYSAKDLNLSEDLDVTQEEMLTLCMSGLANLIQTNMPLVLQSGVEYAMRGMQPYDFVVSLEEAKYFKKLTKEQRDLLNMVVEGEA